MQALATGVWPPVTEVLAQQADNIGNGVGGAHAGGEVWGGHARAGRRGAQQVVVQQHAGGAGVVGVDVGDLDAVRPARRGFRV